MDLLEDIKMSLLNFNFIVIYIIYKMLLLLKNSIFEYVLRTTIIDFLVFIFLNNFLHNIY